MKAIIIIIAIVALSGGCVCLPKSKINQGDVVIHVGYDTIKERVIEYPPIRPIDGGINSAIAELRTGR